MTTSGDDASAARFVIVPRRPGPLAPVRTEVSASAGRDEIDDVLDDVFGEPDQRGPGVTDAVLVGAGAAAAVGGAVASAPVLIVAGVAAAALGGVLPAREMWRRVRRRRTDRATTAAARDGIVLRVDGPNLEFVDAYNRVIQSAARVTSASVRAEIESSAHAAAYEVASLLDGHRPGAAEVEYVRTRTAALRQLTEALAHLDDTELDSIARQARLEARREVESHVGSSLDEMAALAKELRDDGRD